MKEVTTRKNHDCFGCGKLIPKGAKAKVWLEKIVRVDGSGTYFESHYFHTYCEITPNWRENEPCDKGKNKDCGHCEKVRCPY